MTTREEIAIITLFSLVFILLIVKITLQNMFVGSNTDYIKLSDDMQKVQMQNNVLKDEILTYESYLYIDKKAQEMGFTKSQALYIYK